MDQGLRGHHRQTLVAIGRMDTFFSWADAHQWLLFGIGLGSFVFFVGALLAVPYLVGRLPADYFRRYRAYRRKKWIRHPVLRPVFVAAKNAFGVVLLLAGIAMLVLPGQGILTLLAGLMFLDFPGRDRLVLRIVRSPTVWKGLNWLRRRAGKRVLEPMAAPRPVPEGNSSRSASPPSQ